MGLGCWMTPAYADVMAYRLSMRLVALAVAVLGGTACREFDPEDALSISQGIYGMTTYVDDVCRGECEVEPISMTLLVQALPGETEVASVQSNRDGFYQLSLEPGQYRICTTFGRCTDFSVSPLGTPPINAASSPAPSVKEVAPQQPRSDVWRKLMADTFEQAPRQSATASGSAASGWVSEAGPGFGAPSAGAHYATRVEEGPSRRPRPQPPLALRQRLHPVAAPRSARAE